MNIWNIFKQEPFIADTYEQGGHTILTSDGRYDPSRLTADEHDTILAVLHRTDEKYAPRFRAIGLTVESQPILYKARYILHDIIILRHSESETPLDRLAVGLAYSTKGAYYRPQAIAYLTDALPQIKRKEFQLLSKSFPLWSIYDKLADLCEGEALLDDALKYSKLAADYRPQKAPIDFLRPGELYRKLDINRCVKYYRALLLSPTAQSYRGLITEKLEKAEALAAKGYVYKPRKRKQSEGDVLFDKQVEAAARYFCE